jgi:DNA-binding FrmR family transcriptional regulator
MLAPADHQVLVTRLNRIEGQIRGIRKMVQDERPCIDVLQQLAAAEAALNRIALAMVRHHIDHCIGSGLEQDGPERRQQLDELIAIFDRYSR